jgi:hypothetical protein
MSSPGFILLRVMSGDALRRSSSAIIPASPRESASQGLQGSIVMSATAMQNR